MTKKTKKPDLTKLTEDQAQEEFAKLIEQIVKYCSSDIQRHSMEHFIRSPLPREQQYKLALKIAELAYCEAVNAIDAFFLNNGPKTPTI